ncbi:MAG: tripartite tricarboxylate transporter substrate binding protein [Xanthobacteraceae bacterium]|nr:tripartite tricarboxylate transporter substrate binding protein [Xanthobacteraceae bacterium]
MKFDRRTFLRLVAAAAATPALAGPAGAQAYPTRPVRMIVPFAPGGQNDAIGRLIAQKLSEHFGRQYVIENVGGGGGVVGTHRAAQAAPDGYTLLVMDTGFVINPFVYPKVPYDPFKDFEAVSIPVTTTQVLTVTPSLPVRTVKELVELVKANPGKYSYASPGIGTPGHMTAELFRLSLGLDLVHVPFNGAGPAVASTIGGHTPIAFGSPASSVAQVKDGKLRGLAVASGKRLVALPDLPTMAQAGFPDIDVEFWIGIFAPASTPKDIVAALNREVDKAVALPDVRQRLDALGFEAAAIGSADAAAKLKSESAKWAKVVQAAGIKAG